MVFTTRDGVSYIRGTNVRGRDGPRGDPAGPLVLPPRLRREPDGGRLWRRHANRLRPDAPRWREALRRREDVARARRRHAGGWPPRGAPCPSLPGLPAGGIVGLWRRPDGGFGGRGARPRRPPRGPWGRPPPTTGSQTPGRESPRPRS